MSSLALVTGATGAIGPSLVNYLLRRGVRVRSYGLDDPAPGLFADTVEHLSGDINDAESLARALAGVEVVFHLAALLHIENPAPDLAPRYHRVNVEGARTVAQSAVRAGVPRLVYFSTVKVYGVHQREPVREMHPTAPETLYAQTKLAGEHVVRAANGIETCVLRLSAVYGPRLKGSWSRLVRAIERGYFVPVGSLQNRHSLTYVDDVAQAAWIAARHPAASGQVYNVVGFEAPRLQDILAAIYAAVGKPMPRYRVPGSVILAGARAADWGLRLVGRRAPLRPDALRQLVADEVYSGQALRDLEFAPALTLAQSWQQTIAEMQR